MNINMRAGQYQQQRVKMAMKQQLTQSIAILQYSTHELAAYLEEKMMENPLLAMDETRDSWSSLGVDYRSHKQTGSSGDANEWIEQVSADDHISLEDYLLSQVNVQSMSKEKMNALKLLIRNLDDFGYLRNGLEDIGPSHFAHADLQDALEILQGLEPYGVGARDLQECLWIQAHVDRKNLLAEKILLSHFEDFADKKWKELSKRLGASLKDIQRSADYISSLNPRPALSFQQEQVSYVVPDVIVTVRKGQLCVEDVEGNSSMLRLDKQYYNQMNEHSSPQIKQYFREKWQEYQWISKAIKQRKETILRVMHFIVMKQPACFAHGLEHMKPMTMKEAADELDIHESTVSRTVNGKYVQTPFGTFEMRIFFTVSLASVEREDEISAHNVKRWIADQIGRENKKRPLSDQELVEVLKHEHGLMIARRTVAKYREQLGFASSSKRKRYD